MRVCPEDGRENAVDRRDMEVMVSRRYDTALPCIRGTVYIVILPAYRSPAHKAMKLCVEEIGLIFRLM